MKFRLSPLYLGLLLPSLAQASITQGEYSLNTLVEAGNGTPITLAPNDLNLLTQYLDVSTLGEGQHTLYIRIKDDDDNWSPVITHSFYQQLPDELSDDANQVIKLEANFEQASGAISTFDITGASSKPVTLIETYIDVSKLDQGSLATSFSALDSYTDTAEIEAPNLYLSPTRLSGAAGITSLAVQINQDGFVNLTSPSALTGSFFGEMVVDVSKLNTGANIIAVKTEDDLANTSALSASTFDFQDRDNDDIDDRFDIDLDNDGLTNDQEIIFGSNPLLADTDADGLSDKAEFTLGTDPTKSDTDNDTVNDNLDALPNDPTETMDTDGDGTGNNADTDDDNDGVLDGLDAFPLNKYESADTDNDGIGDNADIDDNNDGIIDAIFAFTNTTWKHDKTSAYSMQHDDFCAGIESNVKDIITPALIERGFVASFGIIANECSATEWLQATEHVVQGMTLFNHSMNHNPAIKPSWENEPYTVTWSNQVEISDANNLIAEKTGYRPSLMAMPYDIGTDATAQYVRDHQDIIAMRGTSELNGVWVGNSGINDKDFNAPYALQTELYQPESIYWGLGENNRLPAYLDATITAEGWGLQYFHGVADASSNAVSETEYLDLLDKLKLASDSGDVWVSAPEDVIDYRFAREHCELTFSDLNDKMVTYQVTDSEECKAHSTQLTVQTNFNGTITEIIQDNKLLPFTVKNGILQFEYDTNKGDVKVNFGNATIATPWLATSPYNKGDKVTHNGMAYTAKWNVPAGKEPGKSDYWEAANTSDTSWSVSATYIKGAEVTHNGVTYTAKYNVPVGKEPGKTNYWEATNTSDTSWSVSATYIKGAEVTHNGVTYTAKYNVPVGKEPGKTNYWETTNTSDTSWSVSATYIKGAEVTHNGVTYTAKYNVPVGKEPGKTNYWVLLVN